MKPHTQDRLTSKTKPRSYRASFTKWYIPEEHLGKESSLVEYRLSGFHDPIGLRRTNDDGLRGIQGAEYESPEE